MYSILHRNQFICICKMLWDYKQVGYSFQQILFVLLDSYNHQDKIYLQSIVLHSLSFLYSSLCIQQPQNMKNYSKYLSHSSKEKNMQLRQEATEESLIYYYLCILILDCAANHTNNDPTFKLFCHIFLLAHAVLCSHPLALSRVDISPQ